MHMQLGVKAVPRQRCTRLGFKAVGCLLMMPFVLVRAWRRSGSPYPTLRLVISSPLLVAAAPAVHPSLHQAAPSHQTKPGTRLEAGHLVAALGGVGASQAIPRMQLIQAY